MLGSGHAVRVIGLDVSQNVILRLHQLNDSPFAESPMGRFLGQALLALMAAEQPVRGERCAVLHDPATIAAVACRNLFRYEPRPLEICVVEGRERGLMRRSDGPLPVVSWAVEVNSSELLDLFQHRLTAWSGAAG